MCSKVDGSAAPGFAMGLSVSGSVCARPKRHFSPDGQVCNRAACVAKGRAPGIESGLQGTLTHEKVNESQPHPWRGRAGGHPILLVTNAVRDWKIADRALVRSCFLALSLATVERDKKKKVPLVQPSPRRHGWAQRVDHR